MVLILNKGVTTGGFGRGGGGGVSPCRDTFVGQKPKMVGRKDRKVDQDAVKCLSIFIYEHCERKLRNTS